MADNTALQDLLIDAFGRIHQLVGSVTDGIDEATLTHRPDPDANTVAWLIWHLTRIQDDHVAGLAGEEQVWTAAGWADRFELPFDRSDTGYSHSTEDVGAVRASAELLRGYHEAVNAATERYLATVDDAELERVVDEHWDPPVTASVRLVSVISDCLQHLGQAAYVKGLAERA
ncbi:mycothiol transferase [soil metagenome]